MPVADDPPLHDFPDRALRQSLQQPANLRAFLRQAVPELADGFVYEQARLLDREFPLDDWRRRASDLVFEIPYRGAAGEQLALVCVLIEHQSEPDPRMPLRLLVYAVLYWERQWKAWEETAAPRPPLRLTPVLPVVLHTGARPWGTHRQLADLLAGPEAFHGFAPRWQPLFWDLAERSPEALLSADEAWLQFPAVVRVEGAEAEAFEAVFREAFRRLEALHGPEPVRWYDLARLVWTWAVWRRPREERDRLLAAAAASQTEPGRQREVEGMGQTIAEWYIEQGRAEGEAKGEARGRAEGEAKGEARGRAEGEIKALHRTLLRLGGQRLGAPDAAVTAAVEAIADRERLERLADGLLQAASWQELLGRP
jgi:hypothetical protein